MSGNMSKRETARRASMLLVILVFLSGCGVKRVDFRYPREELIFPSNLGDIPGIYIAAPLDLRPEIQKSGQGHVLDIRFPADKTLIRPITDIYAAALNADLAQTMIAIPVRLPSQADYILNSEISAFSCRLRRNPSVFVLPLGAGLMGGFFMSDDTSGRLKRAAVLAVVALGALPVRAKLDVLVEVKLILRDPLGETVWEKVCVGEIEDTLGEAALSRRDKYLAERYLPQAVKRANACLLGQLRQFLVTR